MKIQGSTIYEMERERMNLSPAESKPETILELEDRSNAPDYDQYQASQQINDKKDTKNVIYDTNFLRSMGIQIPDVNSVRFVGDPKLLEEMQKDYYTQKAFEENGGQQWTIFRDQLKESGFYQSLSVEKQAQIDQKLQQITSSLDSFYQYQQRFGGENKGNVYEQVTYKGKLGDVSYQDWFYMSKEQWQEQLGRAKKELENFCAEYLPEDQKSDFTNLIYRFEEHNEDLLKDYHALGEDTAKATLFEAMQQKDSLADLMDDVERLLSDIMQQMAERDALAVGEAKDGETQEQTYIDVLKAFFTQVASSQGVSTTSLMPSDDTNSILEKLDQEMWQEEQVAGIQEYYASLMQMYRGNQRSTKTDAQISIEAAEGSNSQE